MTRGSTRGITTHGITVRTGIIHGIVLIGDGGGVRHIMLIITTIIIMTGGVRHHRGIIRPEAVVCMPIPGVIADMPQV